MMNTPNSIIDLIDTIDILISSNNPNTTISRIPEKITGSSNIVCCIKQRYTIDTPAIYNGMFVEMDDDFKVKRILVYPVPITFNSTDKIADNARPFIDGSWLRVFWNPFKEEWSFASSQLFNGNIMTWAEVPIGRKFEQFMDTLDFESMDKNCTYFYVYSDPYITFDPSANTEMIQYIGYTDGITAVFNEKLNDGMNTTCSSIWLANGQFVVHLDHEYEEIKRIFRKDIWTIFAHFYAFPEVNFYGKQSLFAICPRMEKMYMEFVRGPYTSALLELTDYMKTVSERRRSTVGPRLSNNLYQLWKHLMIKCFPTYDWQKPQTTLRHLRYEEISQLFDVQNMAQAVAKLLSEQKPKFSLRGIVVN